MFERFSEEARRVVFYARQEAGDFGSKNIEELHLLLGVLREDPGILSDVVPQKDYGELVRESLKAERGVPIPETVDLPLSQGGVAALKLAIEEADRRNQDEIWVGHVLLGLLGVPDSRVLAELCGAGANRQQLTKAAEKRI